MKRILSLMLVFVMLATMVSYIASIEAEALPGSTFRYKLRISTRDETYAGTNASIYAGFDTYTDGVRRVHLDKDDYDDFERGDTDDYNIDIYSYPWMIKGIHVHQGDNKGASSDWKPGSVQAWFPTMTNTQKATLSVGSSYYIGGTFSGGSTFDKDISSLTKRKITSVGTFDNWAKTIYLGNGDSGSLSLTWNANITDQYGTYNPFGLDDAPTLSFTNQFNAGTTTLFTNNFTAPASNKSANMSLTYAQIYNEMVAKGIGKATLNFKLSFPSRSTASINGSSTTSHTETVTIYRKCFDIGNVSYSETPVFTARQDNDYLNSSKKNVTITVAPTSIHVSSSMSDADIKQIVQNFTCTPVLYSGNGTSVKLADMSYAPSSDGKKLVFTGTVPADFTSNGAGVNLYLSNVSTTYNGNKYLLNSGSTNWNYYISTLKVDTQKPTVSITDKDGVTLDITNKIAKEHTFHVNGSETLYKSNTAPHPAGDEAYFNYSLLSGTTKVPVNNYNGGTGSYLNVTVPVSTATLPDLPIILKTSTASEGAYTLFFDGYDDAGNLISNNTLENVLIDSVAPRYTLVDNKSYQDAQKIKHTEFNFTLTDFCNSYKDTLGSWARLYYVFVPQGETLPTLDPDTVSGEIDTTIGKWNFVEADENGTLPTILISLGLKENFKGSLYLFTKDSVGNSTEIINYAPNIEIYNYDTTDTIETSSNLAPKKSFDISFKETVSGVDGIYKTEYRWVPVSSNANPITQSMRVYEGEDVGAGVQYGDDGNPVTLDGGYRLEYKVTEVRSGNFAKFEKNYIFDNLAPSIGVVAETAFSRPLQLQQATIVITDVSGVASASYKIYTVDEELVGEGTLTPTVSGDGTVGVRESIKLQPSENGVYKLVVTAVDVNGDENVYTVSDTFSIRAKKPSVVSAGDDIAFQVGGTSVTSSQDYTVYLQVLDSMIAANSLEEDQFVKYQVSTDGINYGPWNILNTPMDAADAYLSQNAVIESPVTLTEGRNTLYFKVACAEDGNTADPALSLVSDVYSYDIIYDTTAPAFDLDYSTSSPTKEDVTVTVTVSDANGITDLALSNSLVTLEKESDVKYILTVKRNVDTFAVLSDAVGNEVRVPFAVSCIDKDAPVISALSNVFESGARRDASIKLTIKDANVTDTVFGLVKDPTSDSVIDEESIRFFETHFTKMTMEKNDENGVVSYKIILRGLDGNYGLGIKTVDLLGNESIIRPAGLDFNLVDAEPEILTTVSTPEITKSTATVTNTLNVPLFILDPMLATGENDEENESIALAQGGKTYKSEFSRVVSDNSPQKVYVVDEANRAYTLTFASDTTFIEGFKLVYTLFKNGEEIENNSFISFEENDTVKLVVTSNPDYSEQTFDMSSAVLSGYEFNEEESEKTESGAYTKLVFTALHDSSTEKSVAFKSYTAEGFVEEERYQDELIITSVFDDTAPTVKFNPSIQNNKPTNQDVTINATFGDAESGIASVTRDINGVKTTLSSKTSDSVTFAENGKVTYTVTNNAGLSYKAKYEVKNIDKTPILEGEHYTVSYYYQDYLGKWNLIEDGKYYRTVKAVVDFPESDKTVSVSNNGGSTETILTSEKRSFTFEFVDLSGNVESREVSYERYDNEGGLIEWNLSNYNKTNKPVTAFVTISDKDNVNEIVYAEVRDAAGELYEWRDEVLGNEYSVELPLSGNYTVTAYDAAGNEFATQITVSNIDIVKPEITRISYSTPPTAITTRSVLVTIEEFSKSNVTVTGIERSDSLGEFDVYYTSGSTQIRFKKSGFVSVFFVDDYGNENASVISVNNIYSEPPALEAVATLAEDELSVSISFVQQYDENGIPVDMYRTLSDLYIAYGGVTYKADENGTFDNLFTIRKNGEYTFTVFDEAGTSQTINLTVENIDDKAPVIKTVSWSYEYLEENGGVWEKKSYEKTLEIGKDTSGSEAGYIVAPDIYKPTNNDVTVTVVTDKDTSILGTDDIKSTSNHFVYAENGLFTFNLAALNGTVSSYGVDVEIIDKEKPVLNIEGNSELIFIEGMTSGKDPDFAYDKSKFYDFEAYDVFQGTRTDLTDKVVIDFGEFNPDDINANVFDRTKPYNITYTVYDSTGNKTEIRRTVRLIGFYDTIALINGKMPNSANAITVDTKDIEVSLKNFGGTAYARIAEGIYTMGQMKTLGTPLNVYNGKFIARNLEDGWYTVFVQTDKRDYFTITVFVDSAE